MKSVLLCVLKLLGVYLVIKHWVQLFSCFGRNSHYHVFLVLEGSDLVFLAIFQLCHQIWINFCVIGFWFSFPFK